MAAYGLSERFPPPPDCHKAGNLDPGAYNLGTFIRKPDESKVPFLSGVPRNIKVGTRIYTHAIYHAEKPHRIRGVTAFKDRCPRFKLDDIQPTYEDEGEYVCNCELKKCTCAAGESLPTGICQASVPRKVYKGHVPLTSLGSSQSMPGRGHRGFVVFPDGTRELIPKRKNVHGPPFYDTRVEESTEFYHGCKWSRRTGRRGEAARAPTPGPADYDVARAPTAQELCHEAFRAERRLHTRQLRFMEMVQLRNILQRCPGPADYDPKLPACAAVRHPGPRALRFPPPSTEPWPGPAEYSLEPARELGTGCRAPLPPAAPLGGRADRFRLRPNENPGPGAYSPRIKSCTDCVKCPPPPFFSSAPRFKPDNSQDCEEDEDDDGPRCCECPANPCVEPTAAFKSRTKRFKPLVKRLDYPSPADLVLDKPARGRGPRRQYLAPFHSSEGRFRPWHDWMSVNGSQNTPGPGVYDLTSRPYCVGGGWRQAGAARFPPVRHAGPPPNAYSVDNGIETVHHTFNKRLRGNVGQKDKFRWRPLATELRSFRSREACLLTKSIHDLDIDQNAPKYAYNPREMKRMKLAKPARPRRPGDKLLLRYFLHDHQYVQY